MAQYFSNELAGTTTGLTTAPDQSVRAAASVYGARVKNFRATVPFASQADGSTVVLAVVPAGYSFLSGSVVVTASTGSAKFAIGTAASAGKYRASAVLTSTNTPTAFGLGNAAAGALTSAETIIATVADAALPSSGTMVIDLTFIGAN